MRSGSATSTACMQMFSQGHLTALSAQLNAPPISLKEALICFAQRTRKFRLTLDEEEAVFILGLQPRHTYQVEIDDEEMFETDDRRAAASWNWTCRAGRRSACGLRKSSTG